MSFRYGKHTFALELVMISVGLLFLFPVYVLVRLSFKSAPEISGGGLGLPSSLRRRTTRRRGAARTSAPRWSTRRSSPGSASWR